MKMNIAEAFTSSVSPDLPSMTVIELSRSVPPGRSWMTGSPWAAANGPYSPLGSRIVTCRLDP